MKKRWICPLVTVLALALVTSGILWYRTPKIFCEELVADDVRILEIFLGASGECARISDRAIIAEAIVMMQKAPVYRSGNARGYVGFTYRLSFISGDGGVSESFIINSSSVLRDDVFFYESEAENLPFAYIGALYEQYKVSED